MYNLIGLSDLIGFGYDLSDTQDGLKCWRTGFYILWQTSSPPDKDSGGQSRAHGPTCILSHCDTKKR